MAILDYFADTFLTATIIRLTSNIVSGVPQDPTETTIGLEPCLLWDRSSAQTFISGRFKETVSLFAAFYPGTNVLTNDRLTIDSEVYSVEHVEDPGNAGEILIAGLAAFDD